ncbi:MAG: TetR family transcriptional regulator [Nonomuraea muscovyensis]|nr:TetR family transcriptional regulator [Nonomuraea muscovyensis]
MGDEDAGRTSLRERKKQQTRIALSWAAIRLTVERGWDNVRVEDIAAEAGVSTRTFNNYFASKGEAIAARHLDRARLIAAELRAQPAGKPLWEAVTSAVLTRFAMEDEGSGGEGSTGGDSGGEGSGPEGASGQWLAGVRLMVTEPALQAEFVRAGVAAEAELAAAIADRTGTDVARDLYPRLVAGAVGAAITVATDQWLRAETPVSMAALLHDALGQLAAGLPQP